MLIAYRRHKKACEHRGEGRQYRRCGCPIWVDGRLAGEEIRISLGTRNWEEAQSTVRKWEDEKKRLVGVRTITPSLADAWEQVSPTWLAGNCPPRPFASTNGSTAR